VRADAAWTFNGSGTVKNSTPGEVGDWTGEIGGVKVAGVTAANNGAFTIENTVVQIPQSLLTQPLVNQLLP
jgi:hypothetical protein